MANVNSTNEDRDPALSPDGLTLYFASKRQGGQGDLDLWLAVRASVAEDFGTPGHVSTVSSGSADEGPYIAADGLSLWFNSARGDGPGGRNFWVTTRASVASAFPAPVLVAELNTDAWESDLQLSSDLLRVYFMSDRQGGSGSYDLWWAERPSVVTQFGTPMPLAGMSSSAIDTDPTVSADELTLLFSTNRATNGGAHDLWMATRASRAEPFGQPSPVTEVNSDVTEMGPFLSADGATLYWSSDRPGGLGGLDLYQATRSCL
jgi:Tol biopolymer transport system component